ncbi:MAG: Sapep family Mn(2+)-dependent dipeptidase [Oscillospiraceae bacterium]|nr:Sapep family Mn(2+)-dependent dipeptidase [Oscillospiraceae bacterium]
MAGEYTSYVLSNKEALLRDIKRLVDIKSVKAAPEPDAPYGAGVRKVQLEAMELCRELGFETVADCEGRIAYAAYGPQDRHIGIVAHLDVVPEGTGWFGDPYRCEEREGFLIGRGVIDDKGPFVVAAYAAKYLIDKAADLKYGVRLILGLDEETGMSDIEYYKSRCPQPVFAFTPDAGFPVGHGEKGIYSADLVSPPLKGGVILKLEGGVASNVVADTAEALLKLECFEKLEQAAADFERVSVAKEASGVKVTAKGVAAHAGTPHEGINANYILADFLVKSGVLSEAEQRALAFVSLAASSFDGEQFGIACDDGLFAPLSIIGGVLTLKDDRIVLNVNSRYPTAITAGELEARVAETARANGFEAVNVSNSGPFYMDPENPAVKLMCEIYNEVTGSEEKPFVMSGGTYARHMENAVSYGLEFPGQEKEDPEWVGSCHMKNEGLKIERALQACEIYIKTLVRLQEVEL